MRSGGDEAHRDADEVGEVRAQAQVAGVGAAQAGRAVEEEVGVDAPVGRRLDVPAVVGQARAELQHVAAVLLFLSDEAVLHVVVEQGVGGVRLELVAVERPGPVVPEGGAGRPVEVSDDGALEVGEALEIGALHAVVEDAGALVVPLREVRLRRTVETVELVQRIVAVDGRQGQARRWPTGSGASGG